MKRPMMISGGLIGLTILFGGATCSNPFQGGVATTAATIAQVVSHSTQACADLAALGADGATIASQVAAANPNNASIQKAASAVTGGVNATNADCQSLAAAFTAEAPKSLLHRRILIDPKVFARIK